MNVIDLFCGCGGLSLGAAAAGLTPALAFDVDAILTSSFAFNHPHTKLVLTDLAKVSGRDIQARIGKVDGVIGGPPCQAFSEIGLRKADDPRRSLLGHFFKLVAELQPTFFVAENVRGLGYSNAQPVLEDALNLLPGSYQIVGPMALDAAEFGAATRRPRLFIVGYKPDHFHPLTTSEVEGAKRPPETVRSAITDLGTARLIGTVDGFDSWKIGQRGRPTRYAGSLRAPDGSFTGHRRTLHSRAVIRRFTAVPQGGRDAVGRHYRLNWDGQCPTLCAGTGADHGSHQSVRPIHPDEPRVITVREAARLQGFPDAIRFHPTVWHSFRMIGNSVSPVMSRAVFDLIASRLDRSGELSSDQMLSA